MTVLRPVRTQKGLRDKCPTFRVEQFVDAQVFVRQFKGVLESLQRRLVQLRFEVEQFGLELVDQGVEGQSVRPAGGEVADVNAFVALE